MKDRNRFATTLAALSLPVLAGAARLDQQRRLTPNEASVLPPVRSGPGTSGVHGIETRLLYGDPTQSGLYTISITVPANTRIAVHTHRDLRTAVVVAGVWHFGYGATASGEASRALPAGSIYTEPAGDRHFAWTGPEGATVYITGVGPSDTVYASPASTAP